MACARCTPFSRTDSSKSTGKKSLTMKQVYLFMTAMFSALIMVPFLRQWALASRTVDLPDARKVHRTPVPRIGGIAVYMAFLFALLVFMPMAREVRGVMAGGLILFVTGLVDDLYGISPGRKFMGQIFGTVIAMAVSGVYIHTLGNLTGSGELVLPLWAGVPFTIVAVVGVINAINLIDGLDGLAGGVSVIALAAFLALAYHDDNVTVMMITSALLGALLGFLKYNFFPARVFMGDTGSLTVGFVLAFTAIYLTQLPGARIEPAVPLVVLGLPIVDTVWVMGNRLRQRRSPFAPDMTHVHHKFLMLGLEHRYTVVIIYGISLFWAVVATLCQEIPPGHLLAIYLVTCGISYLCLRHLLRSQKRLPFVGRDSDAGIRESRLYRRLSGTVAGTTPFLALLMIVYLTLAVIAACRMVNCIPQLMLVLAGGSLALMYITRDPATPYVLIMFYAASMVIAFVVTRFGGILTLDGIPLKEAGDLLIALMLPLAAFRVVFRQHGEFYLEGVDHLLLGVTIFLALVVPQLTDSLPLNGVFARGIMLFSVLKVLTVRGQRTTRTFSFAMVSVLLVIAVRGYLGL